MRSTAIALNSIVTVFFAAFVAYTFVARQHLESHARRFATEKTVVYAGSLVDVAEQSLDSPLVQKLLTDDHARVIRDEIAEYRRDPSAYVSDLLQKTARIQQQQQRNPLLERVASVKERIRAFYADTLAALIGDLQIFAISNLCAGVIALGLAIRSRAAHQQSAVWFSFLMFVAVLYCGFMYVNDLTFFRILFRLHMGWWYPVLLCLVLAGLYRDYGRRRRSQRAKPESPGEAKTSSLEKINLPQ
ncbi:MAG TPA: hypothetical protein VHC19_03295 [Pirellulales bacterium]|nr:hypothetical protein [Pirellulales bacterium]